MGSIFAEKTLYGSDAVITNPAKSGRASGSASRDANRLLRFYLRGSPFVSGPRSLTNKRPYRCRSPPLLKGGQDSKPRLFRWRGSRLTA